jgi:hydroxymethylpyrimidine kinase/phosphomethylpyrimidine kinase
LILCIGGSDSSGGAGLEQDRRTAERLGCPVCSAVTAITVQGRKGVYDVEPVRPDILRRQIEVCLTEENPLAVKIGALVTASQISLILSILIPWKKAHPELFIVVDPVFAPTKGAPFLRKEDIRLYPGLLFLADVVTPNRGELENLSGLTIDSPEKGEKAARKLANIYNLTVILTGGHFAGSRLEERVVTPNKIHRYRKRRCKLVRNHGTGCCLATALTVNLAKAYPLEEAFTRATRTVSRMMGNRSIRTRLFL